MLVLQCQKMENQKQSMAEGHEYWEKREIKREMGAVGNVHEYIYIHIYIYIYVYIYYISCDYVYEYKFMYNTFSCVIQCDHSSLS